VPSLPARDSRRSGGLLCGLIGLSNGVEHARSPPAGLAGRHRIQRRRCSTADHHGECSSVVAAPASTPGSQERDRRQTLRRRRRDLLFALLGVATVSGLLGMIPSLQFVWVVTALSVIALVGYMALVVYAEQLRTEQQRLARMRRETAPPVTTPFLDQDYWEDDEPEPARAAAGR